MKNFGKRNNNFYKIMKVRIKWEKKNQNATNEQKKRLYQEKKIKA